MTFTLAVDALWEWETDQRHGKGDSSLCLPWRSSLPPRGDRSGCRLTPSLLSQAPAGSGLEEVGGGDPTLMATAGPCPQPEGRGCRALCDRAARWPCRTHPMPCWLSLLQLQGRRMGPSASGSGSPAHCAPTLTAGSKTVTPDLFSLQLNLNHDYSQGEPPLLSPSPCGRSSVTSGLNAEPNPSQGMGELALLGIGAARDGVTTAPVPRPGPGSEGTATAVIASLQGWGFLSKSVGDVPPISCLCHGWFPAPKLHPRSAERLVEVGCTHCPLT